MKLTISVDDRTLGRAHSFARKRGISLRELLRRYIKSLAGFPTTNETADQLMAILKDHAGRSGGARIERNDAYDDRI